MHVARSTATTNDNKLTIAPDACAQTTLMGSSNVLSISTSGSLDDAEYVSSREKCEQHGGAFAHAKAESVKHRELISKRVQF